MGTVTVASKGSQQCSPAAGPGDGPGAHSRIAQLEAEVARLGIVAQEKQALEELVAELREANQNLVLATVNAQSLRDDAEAVNRRQNEFLAMLAHELRNPLAPVGMAAALLSRVPDATAQMLNLAQLIGRQVGHMSRLLDDLLDAARISSGKITLSPQAVQLRDVISQAVETVQPRIGERGQELVVALPSEPLVLYGDMVRLTQVFTNLLANASKYTGDGGTIRISAQAGEGGITVRIEDNGAGIAEELLPRIFDLFTQGPRSLARSEGGLGIGLNVVRNLVAMHGGQVEVSSCGPGCGSTFTVVLPVSPHPVRQAAAPPASSAGGAALRVLVVEDNVDACDTLLHLLSLEGHAADAAHDGNAGLEAVLGTDYDVLVCDIGLPGVDGLELIARLRGAKGAAGPFSIALSGYCQAEDSTRALDAGFDHYFVKPVSPDALLALISSQAQQRRGVA